ncbi:MAG: DUF1415 domain-containing protein [Betaproteobacteria bacterium]|nr:DUF1415 domain-containing protein [Betaproteobacteria bacterium]
MNVIALTRAWIERAVIGLNLCPFAKAPYVKERIRYCVSHASSARDLLQDLRVELQRLVDSPVDELETTLLIHPQCLNDFLDFNDFLGDVDTTLRKLGLEGTIQVASFHPQYQFADSGHDDLSNATNQSPFPMLHLLREDSIDRAVETMPNPERIYTANIESLERLGARGWQDLLAQCRGDVRE